MDIKVKAKDGSEMVLLKKVAGKTLVILVKKKSN